MIHLDVKKCCESCPNFVATSDTAEIFADGELKNSFHVVFCAKEQECEEYQKYTEKAIEAIELITPDMMEQLLLDEFEKVIRPSCQLISIDGDK